MFGLTLLLCGVRMHTRAQAHTSWCPLGRLPATPFPLPTCSKVPYKVAGGFGLEKQGDTAWMLCALSVQFIQTQMLVGQATHDGNLQTQVMPEFLVTMELSLVRWRCRVCVKELMVTIVRAPRGVLLRT